MKLLSGTSFGSSGVERIFLFCSSNCAFDLLYYLFFTREKKENSCSFMLLLWVSFGYIIVENNF